MEPKDQKITTAALRLFHQHGYRKVTMSDIAKAAEMSRPSLYAAYPNKEAVFTAIARAHLESNERETEDELARATSLEQRLERIIEIWIVSPFASVIDSPNGLDLVSNAETYAPEAIGQLYTQFERHLVAVLKPEMARKRGMTARDLGHILMLAMKGLKTSTTTVAELRRMAEGLIAMAVATARATTSP